MITENQFSRNQLQKTFKIDRNCPKYLKTEYWY